jgi:hypothetical protein
VSDRIPRISRSPLWRAGFIEAQGFRCHYCNRPGGPTIGPDARAWHVDHKNPLADGGEDAEDNLALACKRCNIAKGTQPYKNFRAYARAAFWSQAPEAVDERQLDDLLNAWAWGPQGTWSFRQPQEEPGDFEVWSRPEGEISDSGDDLVARIPKDYGRRATGHSAATFLVLSHRLVPRLIAELRTLRAELAEARTDPATESPEAA